MTKLKEYYNEFKDILKENSDLLKSLGKWGLIAVVGFWVVKKLKVLLGLAILWSVPLILSILASGNPWVVDHEPTVYGVMGVLAYVLSGIFLLYMGLALVWPDE